MGFLSPKRGPPHAVHCLGKVPCLAFPAVSRRPAPHLSLLYTLSDASGYVFSLTPKYTKQNTSFPNGHVSIFLTVPP